MVKMMVQLYNITFKCYVVNIVVYIGAGVSVTLPVELTYYNIWNRSKY